MARFEYQRVRMFLAQSRECEEVPCYAGLELEATGKLNEQAAELGAKSGNLLKEGRQQPSKRPV